VPMYISVLMVAPKAPESLCSTTQTMPEMQSTNSMDMTGMAVSLKSARIDLLVWDHLAVEDSVEDLEEVALAMEAEEEEEVSEAVEALVVEDLEGGMVVVEALEVVVDMVVEVVPAVVVAVVDLNKAALHNKQLSLQIHLPTLPLVVESETQSSMFEM
jgi:hypothetical protein